MLIWQFYSEQTAHNHWGFLLPSIPNIHHPLFYLLLLVDRSRVAVLDEIAQKFLELSYKQESIAIAKVTSSVQLSARQQQNIAEKLKVISGAKQIKLALKVDPQLIGGFTVEIGSKLIDTSIRGQLRQISSLLGA